MTERRDDLAAASVEAKWRPSLAMVIGAVLTIVLTLPLAGMGAVVALSRSPDSLLASLSANIYRILATGLVIVAVTALVGFFFWRLVNRPMQDLVRWTAAVAARPQDRQLPAVRYGTQELARLAASFDEMVARLRERSDYITTFTAHVSHELKSPLTSIAGAAELMRDAGDQMNADARAHFLHNIETDTVRLSALVERMRDLARAENFRPGGSADLSEVADGLRKQFPSLTVAIAGDAVILPLPLEDALAVFCQLADNALAHGARTLTIRADDQGDGIGVVVSNDGEPISAGNRARIFEPFYTTRRESGGTGMGLVIARAMLKAHGSDIMLDDTAPGVGFRLTLPCDPRGPSA
jgi:signal transduction histidine kinase